MKTIDLTKTVYELACEHDEFIEIMAELGFTEIRKKAMLHSVGKLMTVPKGSKMKKIPMEQIVAAFQEKGFTVKGYTVEGENESPHRPTPQPEADDRTELLKSYLRRLSSGEPLEAVRADFVENFKDVEAAEIMRAEQELLREGAPLHEVQRLCDVHSALFHGATRQERIDNAERAVQASLLKEAAEEAKDGKVKQLVATAGHPLYTLTKENEVLAFIIETVRKNVNEGNAVEKLREIAIHYAKKGDLIYPLLKVKYQISGPSEVMWTVDDEIRAELSELAKRDVETEKWNERLTAVLNRMEEMIYKEANILFPICAENFSDEEWKQIYRDSKDYAECLGIQKETWTAGETAAYRQESVSTDGEVRMPGGHLTVEQLTALLNTIPMEITFVDADNINRFFNEGPKVFKRPTMAIDREVFSCHPPKIEVMVRKIIDDFRNGRQNSIPIWMEKEGRTMLVTYMAVRDNEGKYVGTVELVQDMEFAKEHF